jgi:signal peptidase I
MSTLTAALYAAAAGLPGGWFLGHWIGNFSLLLFLLTLVTLAYWLAERCASSRRARPPPLRWSAGRRRAAPNWPARASPRSTATSRPRAALLMQPWWLDWTAGCSR